MPVITYSSIPHLAHQLKSTLSKEDIKLLVEELIKNNTQIQEDSESIAYGNYARTTKVCSACGRPV
jgi:carboxypeptidase C (cathepsin A)